MPFLKDVPKEWQIEGRYLEVIRLIDGVEDFEFSYVTGNALVKYDSNKITPDEIIESIKKIAEIGKENHSHLQKFTSDKKLEALEFLKNKIEHYLNKKGR